MGSFGDFPCLKYSHIYFLWYLQFGMLIEFLFEKFPDWEDASETGIGDLQVS